jgi:hypothetical protein
MMGYCWEEMVSKTALSQYIRTLCWINCHMRCKMLSSLMPQVFLKCFGSSGGSFQYGSNRNVLLNSSAEGLKNHKLSTYYDNAKCLPLANSLNAIIISAPSALECFGSLGESVRIGSSGTVLLNSSAKGLKNHTLSTYYDDAQHQLLSKTWNDIITSAPNVSKMFFSSRGNVLYRNMLLNLMAKLQECTCHAPTMHAKHHLYFISLVYLSVLHIIFGAYLGACHRIYYTL